MIDRTHINKFYIVTCPDEDCNSKVRDLVNTRNKNERIYANFLDFKQVGEVVHESDILIKKCNCVTENGFERADFAFRRKKLLK